MKTDDEKRRALLGIFVADETSARRFIAACVDYIGLGFHPDETFGEYLDGETGRRLFPDETATWLDEQMDAADAFGFDLADVALECLEKSGAVPPQMPTNRELTSHGLTVGARVRLRRDVERYPHFIARKGMTGTVTNADESGGVNVRMDAFLNGAQEWSNEVVWYDADLPDATRDLEATAAHPFEEGCDCDACYAEMMRRDPNRVAEIERELDAANRDKFVTVEVALTIRVEVDSIADADDSAALSAACESLEQSGNVTGGVATVRHVGTLPTD